LGCGAIAKLAAIGNGAVVFLTGSPYIMQNDDFEWDDAKAAINLREHDVSFEAACLAFADVFATEREDTRETYGEVRYNLIGMVDGRLLHVTYTPRGERIRIVSARLAEPREKRRYYEQNARE
jgi:uncharacterized protein